jgi:hypothetical protein
MNEWLFRNSEMNLLATALDHRHELLRSPKGLRKRCDNSKRLEDG